MGRKETKGLENREWTFFRESEQVTPLEGMTFKLRPQTSKPLDIWNGNSMCKGPEVEKVCLTSYQEISHGAGESDHVEASLQVIHLKGM